MITFVICVALQFEVAWCSIVSGIKSIMWEPQNFNSTCWSNKVALKPWHQNCISMFCLLYKAKSTSPKNFSHTVSEQRCAVLIKSSFSVYLGNLCTSFPALVNTQYQPISRFVTSSSQIVFCFVFFFLYG